MKKILAPLTLIFLVACQPSQLERCVEANTEPTPINEYIIKDIEQGLKIEELSRRANNDEELLLALDDTADDFINSLNPLEVMVNICLNENIPEGLLDLKYEEFSKIHEERVASCMLSTANEVKELQLVIEEENIEKAKSICHSQGIY